MKRGDGMDDGAMGHSGRWAADSGVADSGRWDADSGQTGLQTWGKGAD